MAKDAARELVYFIFSLLMVVVQSTKLFFVDHIAAR